jgi:bifunctional polynucleotide phosphatase/kinase
VKRPSSSIGELDGQPNKRLPVNKPTTLNPPAPVHPFFSAAPTTSGSFIPSPPTVAHFLNLDPFHNLGESSKKIEVVFYDLDGTLIKTLKSGSGFPTSRADWQWWDLSVPGKLKREVEEGKHLVVLSNQADSRPKIRAEWKAKLPLIASKVCALSSSSYTFLFWSSYIGEM